MDIFVIGLGLVGRRLAKRLKEKGHSVAGTTTTPEKVAGLEGICDRVVVLEGAEAEKITAFGQDCDAIAVTVGPNLERASNPATREEEYRSSLSVTCANAAAANQRVVFGSSLSVYGDGGSGSEPVTEESALSTSQDASPRFYQEAEGHVLRAGMGAVLRFPDIYGRQGDISYTERVRLGHSLMGGRVPFSADALLYRLHAEDAAAAIAHVLVNGLVGVYNVVDDREKPPANQAVFDRLAEAAGMEPLAFLGMIKLPEREISAEKIAATGFEVVHTDYEFE